MDAAKLVVGMDVHKKSIAVAVLRPEEGARLENLTIANEPAEITKLVQNLAARGSPQFCYEAGPCGDWLDRSPALKIARLGHYGALFNRDLHSQGGELFH